MAIDEDEAGASTVSGWAINSRRSSSNTISKVRQELAVKSEGL
ncbi:hypothetical protein [Microseira wollei]|uniref:Uncharacterized protein n=1 Tax=Microseira wollei NIES-4236 TaxID=2530354 RepID=A0AAV3XBC7_9CYAN|nr:hypothetical protein [Microseira wollei]GET37582.1 hypothetical protein MiSe_23360 [Microseira wollei NIES-4236]